MVEIDLYNIKGEIKEKIQLPEEIFKVEVKEQILNEVVNMHLANLHTGSACTKTKGDVSGGGIKPWKQKGTGRARAGSIRSPLWRHGGVIFGPKPRDFKYSMPKKKKRLALKGALSIKLKDGQILFIDSFQIEKPKTKIMSDILKKLKAETSSLIVIEKKDKTILQAARNIPKIKVVLGKDLNVYDVLKYKNIIITKEAVSVLKEVFA